MLDQNEGLRERAWEPEHEKYLGHLPDNSHVMRIQNRSGGLAAVYVSVRNFYRKYLKKYYAMQMVAMWTSQKLLWVLLAFRLFFSVCKSRWRKLSLLSDYVATKGIEKHQIVGSQELHLLLKDAVVSPMSDRELLQEREEKTDFPEIYVAVLKLVTVSGRSNFLLVDGVVVCHDLFDCHRDKTSEELHKVVMISPERKLMRWLMHDESPVKVPVAAVFTDACAPNYAHWITEVLPRITVFCAQERYKDIPIVVNGDLHANIMDSLLLVAGPDRGIIILDEGRMIIVDVLYVTSVTGYVPFGRRGNELRGHSHGLFSPHALKAMQEYIKQDKRLVDAYTDWPEKIFLRRDRGARRVSNNDEVEQLVNAQGYRSVDVEKLTFLEQFQLFRNAKVVISPTGAALANAVFCRSGTKILVFMGKHRSMTYRYWENILEPLGVIVICGLGTIDKAKFLGVHGDFSMDRGDVEALMEMLKECA